MPFEKKAATTQKSREARYRQKDECIMEILSALYRGETLSQKEWARRCDVSLRTMQRYINDRLVHHYPIRKSGDTFWLDWAQSDEAALGEEEVAVLEMLEELSKEQGHAFYDKARKVLQKVRRNALNPYFTRLDMEEIDDLLPIAAKLEKAIKQKRLVHCRYKKDDRQFDIDVKPLKIANFQGFWYLIALDARNDILKKYLLRHISRLRIDEERFERPDDVEEMLAKAHSVWFDPDAEPFEVRLFIDGSVAKYFERKPILGQRIEGRDKDGSLEVVVKITDAMEIIPLIKTWLPTIRVLEPKWLDKEIREDIEAYLEKESEV